MAGREHAVLERILHRAGKLKQPQGVGDGGTALAKPLGQLLLTVRQTLAQGLDGLGLFKRVQILALEVFDKRGGQGVLIGQFPQINRHFGKPGALRGPPAALARHDFIDGRRFRPARTHQQRLDDALAPDGGRQFVKRGRGEMFTGLPLAGRQRGDGQRRRTLGHRGRGHLRAVRLGRRRALRRRYVAEQRIQTAPQTTFIRRHGKTSQSFKAGTPCRCFHVKHYSAFAVREPGLRMTISLARLR